MYFKIIIIGFSFTVMTGILQGAEQMSNTYNSSVSSSSATNYQDMAIYLQVIISRTSDPNQLHAALSAVVDSHPLEHTDQTNWPAIRATMAQTILTNLFQLETGLRQTALAINSSLKPPELEHNSVGYLVPTPDSLITNTADREKMHAYRAALRAKSELWNLHQKLQSEYRRHWSAAINILVNAYRHKPISDTEIHRLIETYPNSECTLQFSNQLYQTKVGKNDVATEHKAELGLGKEE